MYVVARKALAAYRYAAEKSYAAAWRRAINDGKYVWRYIYRDAPKPVKSIDKEGRKENDGARCRAIRGTRRQHRP